ncbi:MAG: ABC transporter substrate-binding protein, partial [Halorhabdus sp.]
DPYKKWWDTVSGYWDMAKNGEIEPWGGDFNIMDEIRKDILGPRGWSSNPEKDNYDNYFEKFFQKPENVATVGAWTLGSINGTQSVTLVPNEEHYASDKVNFDEVKITARPSGRANRSALKANTQDYYAGTIPSYIVKSFPDDIEQRLVPGGAGLAFGLDHDSKLFKKRKVRQAIMYALDRERAAKAVHRTKYTPISTPGGHPVNAARLLGEDWVSNNLQSYDRDLDKASQLMQEAGFAKSGGKWTDADGNVLSIQIPTAKGTPTLEPTIANQLSQFGFDASLQTYSGSVYQEKKQNGEFNIWPTSAGASSFVNRMLTLWFYIAGRRTNAEYWGVIPDEDIKDEWGDTSGFPPGKPSERLKGLTVQAPPIGEPEGELKTWEPPHLTQLAVIQSTDKENYIKWSRQLVWIINWLLPIIPIARGGKQHFLDTGHWNWPATDSEIGGSLGVGPEFEAPVSYGQYVSANPDNPEEGASVQE